MQKSMDFHVFAVPLRVHCSYDMQGSVDMPSPYGCFGAMGNHKAGHQRRGGCIF